MPPQVMCFKITLYWDNGNIESFHTFKGAFKVGSEGISIEDGGVLKLFNRRYLRRIDIAEE